MVDEWDQAASFLAEGAGAPVPAEKIIETHAAKIFLIGERAYKIKKPVNLGYLDFSTLDKRRRALERELSRNRNFDGEIYLNVTAVKRGQDGMLHLDGPGDIVEYVLVMRRFPDGALLSEDVERVEGLFAETLGRRVAQIHAAASVIREAWPPGLEYAIQTNADRLTVFRSALGSEEVEKLIAKTDHAFRSRHDLVVTRVKHGYVRRCHGDLHLRNIFLDEGRPILFDCIEFDDRLSDIDILYDIAFLVMDMLHRGQRGGTNRLFNAYLDEELRCFEEEFLDGLSLLPLFLSMRAAVRAHVSAQMNRLEDAKTYLHTALEHLATQEPTLAAVGGVSGTGKTHFARKLAPNIGRAPGAIVLRSDETRKRLWKVRPFDRLPPEAYTGDESRRVYETMHREAARILGTGYSVILDAVYLKPRERAACAELASSQGVPFKGYWLEAPTDILRRRVAGRRGDASDADLKVLDMQLARDPGEIDWQRVNSFGPE